jgi:hypothetical protein
MHYYISLLIIIVPLLSPDAFLLLLLLLGLEPGRVITWRRLSTLQPPPRRTIPKGLVALELACALTLLHLPKLLGELATPSDGDEEFLLWGGHYLLGWRGWAVRECANSCRNELDFVELSEWALHDEVAMIVVDLLGCMYVSLYLKEIIHIHARRHFGCQELATTWRPRTKTCRLVLALPHKLHENGIPYVDGAIEVAEATYEDKAAQGTPVDGVLVVLTELERWLPVLVEEYGSSWHEPRNEDEVLTI